MKLTVCKGRLLLSVFCIGGIMALLGGAILLVFFDTIIKYFMSKELVLKPGNEFYDIWKEVPIPVYQKIYMFNLTNPEDFENGAKPIVQELGPYVFKGRWLKENMEWDEENGTVMYKDVKEYTFAPELSHGTEEDMVFTLNAPLLAVVNYVEEYAPYFLRYLVVDTMNNIFQSYNETLIVHKSIRELIYEGYHEPMVSDLIKVVEPFVTLPLKLINDTFGILHERKHIGDGEFTIKSGAAGLDDYASIQLWNNKSTVDWWHGDSCNRISGTDGVQFAPGIKRNETLRLFNPNLCRSIPIKYEKDVTVHGIKTVRFGMPQDIFATGDENPENECYCDPSKNCRKGIMPMNCKKGAPFVISLPHFLHADPELESSVTGVGAPDEKHKSYLDIDPITGVVLNAAFRIQLNAVTHKLPEYKPLKHVSENIVPVMWMSEEAQLDTHFANYFKKRVARPILAFRIICIFAIVFGGVWTILTVFVFFCVQAKQAHVTQETLKPTDILKTLNSVYTRVAQWPPEETKEQQIPEKTRL